MTERTRIPLHRDPKVRAMLVQALALIIVIYGFYSLFQTTLDNLVSRGIQTGTSFFDEVAPFQIGFSPFFDYKLGESTYIDVFFVGIQNTILVAVLGIIAATLLGFFIGVIRLSPNWLVSRAERLYTLKFFVMFHCSYRLCFGTLRFSCRPCQRRRIQLRWALFILMRVAFTPVTGNRKYDRFCNLDRATYRSCHWTYHVRATRQSTV